MFIRKRSRNFHFLLLRPLKFAVGKRASSLYIFGIPVSDGLASRLATQTGLLPPRSRKQMNGPLKKTPDALLKSNPNFKGNLFPRGK